MAVALYGKLSHANIQLSSPRIKLTSQAANCFRRTARAILRQHLHMRQLQHHELRVSALQQGIRYGGLV
jgi:hypothetical protein